MINVYLYINKYIYMYIFIICFEYSTDMHTVSFPFLGTVYNISIQLLLDIELTNM